jgi:ribosomal protein L11 methyltransferase
VIRLAVRVRREQAELVLAELLELAPAGVEEVQAGEDVIEYAVYGAPGELPGLPDLNAVVGDALVEVSTTQVPDDWHERWKEFHRPVLIPPPSGAGRGEPVPAIRVRPPWEKAVEGSDPRAVREIVIDPGQAFGTGAHPSTRMCLELLLELAGAAPAAGPLLDVGTGSGVLAIAAALLGFEPVLGLDHELESVEATAENALVNDVRLEVRRFDLRHEQLPWMGETGSPPGRRPVVLANLLRPLLLDLAAAMPGEPAHLIASGLLVAEVDEIVAAFGGRFDLRERARLQSGEWAAVWLAGG